MSLHLSRMRRNVTRTVYNDRENVSTAARYQIAIVCSFPTGGRPNTGKNLTECVLWSIIGFDPTQIQDVAYTPSLFCAIYVDLLCCVTRDLSSAWLLLNIHRWNNGIMWWSSLPQWRHMVSREVPNIRGWFPVWPLCTICTLAIGQRSIVGSSFSFRRAFYGHYKHMYTTQSHTY